MAPRKQRREHLKLARSTNVPRRSTCRRKIDRKRERKRRCLSELSASNNKPAKDDASPSAHVASPAARVVSEKEEEGAVFKDPPEAWDVFICATSRNASHRVDARLFIHLVPPALSLSRTLAVASLGFHGTVLLLSRSLERLQVPRSDFVLGRTEQPRLTPVANRRRRQAEFRLRSLPVRTNMCVNGPIREPLLNGSQRRR
ncbi:hypothetical protein MRX96_019370 [Rhipicephalus microplus]